MILTGKAKEDFLTKMSILTEIKDKKDLEEYFMKISDLIKNAYYVDFFDSVGIYIEVYRHNNRPTVQGFNSRIVRRINGYYECCIAVNTRKEATEQAIKKANEIFNSK